MPSLLEFSMAQEEEENDLEAKFDAAVKVIWSLPEEGPFQPSDDMLLRFYGYYMQATQGPCNIPRPSSFWDPRGKVKWDAWSSLGNMTKVEAMKNYVQDIQLILETIPITDDVSDLVQKLDNFFMEVDTDDDDEENDTKSRSFTRPFAQHAVWTPDQSLLMVADTCWRADTRGSGSSAEASVSSLTNGTHSSLNTEMEEDELAYSVEQNVQCNAYTHFNGYVCESLNTILHKNQRSTDSDNEEFCDSMEQLAVEEGVSKILSPGSGVSSVRQKDLWFDRSSARTGGEAEVIVADSFFKDGINACQLPDSLQRGRDLVSDPQSSRTCSSRLCTNVAAPCCAAPSGPAASTNVSEQIAAALLRLQRDMSNVVYRLHALEAHASSQSKPFSRRRSSLSVEKKLPRPSWWPFDFCPLTVVLYGLWPLITYWGVQVYLKHKRRKIS